MPDREPSTVVQVTLATAEGMINGNAEAWNRFLHEVACARVVARAGKRPEPGAVYRLRPLEPGHSPFTPLYRNEPMTHSDVLLALDAGLGTVGDYEEEA